jgi:diguanylate cyclase (GGDEF)-like protein
MTLAPDANAPPAPPGHRQSEDLRRLRRMVLIHLCGILLMVLTRHAGFAATWQVAAMSAYFALGWVVFYTLMRSGRSARLADNWIDTLGAAYGMSAIVLAYLMLDVARGLALQLVCIVLVMHVDRLRLRQALLITVGGIAALLGALGALHQLAPRSIDLRVEAYNLVLAIVLLPIAALLINEAHRVSGRARQHSGELARLLAELRARSQRDTLTGLPNARYMSTLIEHEIARHGRNGQPFCLTLFELDPSGPDRTPAPPAAWPQVARLAAGAIDPADAFAPWSPGCWLLLQPATELADARDTVERVRQAVRRHDWSRLAPGHRMAVSAGTAGHQFNDSPDAALGRAEQALRRAQHTGPDRSATEPELPADARGPRALISLLGARRAAPASAMALPPLARRARPVMRVSSSPNNQTGALPHWLDQLPRRVGDALLSRSPELREHLRLPLTGSLVYLIWLVLLHGYAVPQGLMAPRAAAWLTAYDLVGMLAFYPVIRCGWSARWSDPPLMQIQMLFGCGACALCFATAPVLRVAMLQFMCFIQLFGMAVLAAHHTRVVTLGTIGMQLGLLAWSWATDADRQRFMLEAIAMAASSYIVGSIGLQSYRFARYREQVQQEQGALNDALEQARGQLIHDPLTGLLTRDHLVEQLRREIARRERTGQGFCVALIGLDPFTRVDNRPVYTASDALLQGFATLGRAVLRNTDLLARWTQQEFLALLPDTAAGTQGVQGLERLRVQAATHLTEASDDITSPTQPPLTRATLACGIAEYRPGEPLTQLLARAERGLYAARASGSNRCVLAD